MDATDRTQYRALVAEVAARAKAKLPQAVNGRVESAARLVLMQDVEPQADGSILVGSSSDPLKTYTLTGQACTCQDFARGQAPGGWCQHRIAAGIAKRVRELLPPEPAPVIPEMVEPWPDNDPEASSPPAPQPEQPVPVVADAPAAPLPEAPASVNVRLHIEGREAQLTLRDTDEARLLARLQAVLAQHPATQAAAQADTTPSCPMHGAMKASTKGRGYYCPRQNDDGTWGSVAKLLFREFGRL